MTMCPIDNMSVEFPNVVLRRLGPTTMIPRPLLQQTTTKAADGQPSERVLSSSEILALGTKSFWLALTIKEEDPRPVRDS
jgi:hypothetical protein